jgi:tetratricopeptide (TPR) repeat protein
MLIVLDNAHSAEQVRPLLPGTPECLAIVTSRDRLPGLIAAAGARPISMDLLTFDESRRLLARRLGEERVAADPSAVQDIVERCARLPLALAIVAARAATHPTFPLAALAAQLQESEAGLDAFTAGDPAMDVRAVFSWSYRKLSPDAARLFRQLASHPGPDIAVPAAACLGSVPQRQARLLLDELARANLLTEHIPGRYRAHDLLSAYAAELAHAYDSETERGMALHRVLDYYLHTAHAASRLLDPRQDLIPLTARQAGVVPDDFADHDRALAWFTAEYATLLTAMARAYSNGFDRHTFYLAIAIWPFLERRGRWHDLVTTETTALMAARGLADRTGQAAVHRALGVVYAMLSRYDNAFNELRSALDLSNQLDDPVGQAKIHRTFAWVHGRQGNHGLALTYNQRGLALYRRTGDRAGEAEALTGIGWNYGRLGEYQQAIEYCQHAITLQQEIGDFLNQSSAWDGLGHAHHNLGHHSEAIECYKHALDLYRKTGHHRGAAETLIRLGDTHYAAGNRQSAHTAWRIALDTLDELGHPDADEVRDKLRQSVGT